MPPPVARVADAGLLRRAFGVFDVDGTGTFTTKQLAEMLSRPMSPASTMSTKWE